MKYIRNINEGDDDNIPNIRFKNNVRSRLYIF